MAITASANNLKITARKVRLVADLIRWKTVNEAEALLRATVKKSSLPLLKLLKSAVANAKLAKADPDNMLIGKIFVNDGPFQERVFPRSRGRADRLKKRTSHVTIVLENAPKAEKQKTKNKE
jgi:large subunit ribosomal protein L22